ncbi:S-4TM family putative pore-forming effector [Pseudomonas aeruginosa]|uniref:S-4TM family putative pore-forming effector n=1 Tax=Pseudomonas aeruginosa TaxID=287 RepID=UPI00129298D4|nr:S-4TM family putative pore-forming effector [Pseudomonas aeruginosa]
MVKMCEFSRMQNSEHAILRLAASKYLYSRAKKLRNFEIFLNVVVMGVLTLLSIFLNSDFFVKLFSFQKIDISSWVAVSSILVITLSKLLIADRVDFTKEQAAKIQEQFDRRLYGLVWNNTLLGTEPRLEIVNRYGKRFLRKFGDSKLRDWYPVFSNDLDVSFQGIVCQSSCLSWDFDLRERVQTAIVIIGILVFGVALVAAVALQLSVEAAVVNLVALLGPLVGLGYSIYKENSRSIENSKRLLDCLAGGVDNVNPNDRGEVVSLLVEIQGQLYVKRKQDWPIPYLVYNFFRDGQEADMKYSAKELSIKFSGAGRS